MLLSDAKLRQLCRQHCFWERLGARTNNTVDYNLLALLIYAYGSYCLNIVYVSLRYWYFSLPYWNTQLFISQIVQITIQNNIEASLPKIVCRWQRHVNPPSSRRYKREINARGVIPLPFFLTEITKICIPFTATMDIYININYGIYPCTHINSTLTRLRLKSGNDAYPQKSFSRLLIQVFTYVSPSCR